MGYSTVSGFWIPDKPPPPPPKEAPARAAIKGASAAKLRAHAAVAGKGVKRLPGKPAAPRRHETGDRKPPEVLPHSCIYIQDSRQRAWPDGRV